MNFISTQEWNLSNLYLNELVDLQGIFPYKQPVRLEKFRLRGWDLTIGTSFNHISLNCTLDTTTYQAKYLRILPNQISAIRTHRKTKADKSKNSWGVFEQMKTQIQRSIPPCI